MFTKERLRIGAIVLGVVLLFAYMADWSPEETRVMPGLWHDGRLAEAPGFTLQTPTGEAVSLSQYRGQIVVLNIWATWCAPCLEETPALVVAQQRFRGQGVQFIGLSIDVGHPELVTQFSDRFAVNYPLVMDDGVTADSYEGNTGVPTTYLINRRGQIWQYKPGPVYPDELAEALATMLRAEPA